MEIFSKILTNTDIWIRLEVPTTALQRFNFPAGHHSVVLQVMDWTQQLWQFRLYKRQEEHHLRPAMTGDWLEFVQNKGLQIGDRVIFREHDGGRYRIEAMRKITSTNFKLFGKEVDWVLVDQAELLGVA